MGNKNEWVGRGAAVAQVVTVTVGGTLAGQTFTLSVGGIAVASVIDTDHVAATVAAGLRAAWNASACPYALAVTADGAGGAVVLTADTAGVPFAVTLNTPGGAATFSQAATTASAGPNHWDTAGNWSLGTVPVSTDDVRINGSSVPILWGLDQSGVALGSLYIEKSFVAPAQLGLAAGSFLVKWGQTNSTVPEYRNAWLKVQCADVRLGESLGAGGGNTQGAPLLKLDLLTTANPTLKQFGSGKSPDGKAATRLKCAHAGATILVYDGTLALADEAAADTATAGTVAVYGTGASVTVGAGVTLGTYRQQAGSGVVKCAPATVVVESGGAVRLVGSGTITTLESRGTLDLMGGSYGVTTLKG